MIKNRAIAVKTKRQFCFVLAGLFFANLAIAQNTWQQTNGPFGGTVWALAINQKQQIFAGTYQGGIFISADNAKSWQSVNNGLLNRDVRALAIDAQDAIFAGTFGDGLFRSTDGGASWQQINGGLASNNIFVFSLAIDARTQAIYAGTASGVIRSTDNGETWSQASAGLPNNAGVEALAIDPQSGDIFAALPAAGLFRSSDGGGKWQQIDNGFAATAVLILPNSLVFAGAGDGVYLSRDNGVNWVAAGKGLSAPVIQELASGIEGEIYACTDGGGIFRSVDLGASWTPVNQGLTSSSVRAFAANTNGEFFAGSSGVDPANNRSLGVYRSTDGAATWELANTGLINTKIPALATTNQGGLFAGSYSNGIFRSLDNGKSWQQIIKGLANGTVNDLIISRAQGGEDIYAAIEGFGLGVFRSLDNGDSWQQLNTGLENAPGVQALAINSKGHLWAGSDGAYVSLDNGASWTFANVGIAEGSIASIRVNGQDHLFLAGPLSGVLRSTDDGATWQQVIKGLPNPNVSALAISAGGDLFAAVDGAGLFRSQDNGDNWAPSGAGLPNENIVALETAPGGALLAMPASQGVFLSLDEGQSWQPFTDGLTNTDVLSIASTTNGDIFAGTDGSGVFRNSLPGGAQDVFWNAPVSGNWSAPGNWSTQSIPGPKDRVLITVPGTYQITLDLDATVAGLQIGDAGATGSQALFLNGRSLTLSGKSNVNSSGILDINASSTLTLQAQLDNAGAINWSGGTLAGANKLNNTGILNISGSADKNLRAGMTLENTGAVVWSGASAIRSGEGAVINNLTNAVFDVQGDVLLDGNFFSGDATTFFNVGKLIKSAGSGASTFDATFVNNGQAEWQTGRLDFPLGYTQLGGQTSLLGGDLASTAKVYIQGGLLEGAGSISANVVNSGQLSPGSPVGVLDIKGNYSQTQSGVLNIDIDGVVPGAVFDRLDISGQATFDGVLNIRLAGQFSPSPGSSIVILSFASRSGAFANINGLNISETLRLSATYNANNLTLVAIAPGLSLSPTAIDFGEVTVGELASRSIDLANNGNVDLAISSMNMTGAHATDFTLSGGGPATLQPGGSLTISVQFSPAGEGSRTAALNIISNAPSSPDVVVLTGAGVAAFALFSQVTAGAIAGENKASTSSSWVDIDDDGDDDLFVTSGEAAESNILFENVGDGAFTIANAGDLTTDLGTSRAATWGDFDNDGDADAFIANDSGENNFLYANNGDGALSRIVTGAIATDGGFSTAASWGDFDNDGFLDLFVANRQGPNFLYKNNGASGFEKVMTGAVVADDAASMGCNWVDFDNDGDVDLFVVNGAGQNNALYKNNGNGTFTKIANDPIVRDGGFSRGSSWGDFDNDGDLDAFVANENSEPNFLYANDGNGGFVKVTDNTITTDAVSSAGSAWADLDNDGDLDLFVANAELEGTENFIYLNDGAGSFTRESLFDALGNDAVSQGASVADFDRDGDLDLFIANGGGQPDLFYTNNGAKNNWLGIDLVGAQSNRSAIGAKIRVQTTSGEQTIVQLREISAQTGGGYGGQNSLRAAFGLGAATEINSLEVVWPAGGVQELSAVAANQFLTVTEVRQPVGNIIVEEPEEPAVGDSLSLAVIPPQNFSAVSGQLFYRAAGESAYRNVPLNINPNGFDGTIPPIDVTIRGVQYYIVLSDGQTAITLPPTDPQNKPQFIPAQIARITAPLELAAEKYKMVSVPLALNATAIDSVLFDDYGEHDTFPRIWRLFRWQNLHYAEYRRIEAVFTPGTAFWLITRDGLPFDVENAQSVYATVPFQITLQPGWNQIADPFAFPVAWQNISADGQVQPPVFYDGTEFILDVPVLLPWEGYFVFNLGLSPVTLSVPPIEAQVATLSKIRSNSPLEGGQGGVTDDDLSAKSAFGGNRPYGSEASGLRSHAKHGNEMAKNSPLEGGQGGVTDDDLSAKSAFGGNRPYGSEASGLRSHAEHGNEMGPDSPLEGGQGGVTAYDPPTKFGQISEPENANEYTIQLAATIPNSDFRDTQNFIGFKANAQDGWDNTDFYEAPAISDALTLSILENGDRFAANFRSPTEKGASWEIEIDSNIPKAEIAVELHEFGNPEKAFTLYVLDRDRGAPIQIQNNSFPVVVDNDTETRHLRIILGTENFADDQREGIPLTPLSFVLRQNYPNPFNPSTAMSYQLSAISNVDLTIYDQLGRIVKTLVHEQQPAGNYEATWDGRDTGGRQAASGVYLYRLRAGEFVQTRKMLLMR